MGAPRSLRAPRTPANLPVSEEGPAEVAASPDHGSNNPNQEKAVNDRSNTTTRPAPATRFDPNAPTPKADAIRVAGFMSLEGPILQAKAMTKAALLLSERLFEEKPDAGMTTVNCSDLHTLLFVMAEAEELVAKLDELFLASHNPACDTERQEMMGAA